MTIRSATYIGTVALLSQLLLAHGCGSNNPSTIAAAGTSGTAGAAAGTPAGGTTGAAGAVAGTPSAGTTGAAGAPNTTPAGGTGGAASAPNTTPAGGTAAITTATSSGGSTGASTGAFDPLCSTLLTAAGAIPTKAGVCTATDSQLLLQDLRAQEHRLQVGNLLGRSLPGAVRLLVPHGYRLLLLQDTVSHRSVLSYYCAASQPTLLGRRLRALQRQWWLQ